MKNTNDVYEEKLKALYELRSFRLSIIDQRRKIDEFWNNSGEEGAIWLINRIKEISSFESSDDSVTEALILIGKPAAKHVYNALFDFTNEEALLLLLKAFRRLPIEIGAYQILNIHKVLSHFSYRFEALELLHKIALIHLGELK
jgi:hypothetical protein